MLKWAFKKDSIRVLEIGGGTGSATAALLDRLKENNLTNRIGEYIFSDVSPVFLRMGNRRIMDSAPDDLKYELKRLDFDKPLVLQGIKGNDIDAVYGVNTLHVAKNLSQALKNIHQVIKSGGMLVISECCRPHKDYLLFQEVIFNLLDNYVSVELDSNLRPVSGFLDYDHWKASLLDAGFRNVEAIFNTDADFPQGLKDKIGILVAVIKAEK
jgi:ubiquinone/menaquinone biosynthesis C-methylase UbiE